MRSLKDAAGTTDSDVGQGMHERSRDGDVAIARKVVFSVPAAVVLNKVDRNRFFAKHSASRIGSSRRSASAAAAVFQNEHR